MAKPHVGSGWAFQSTLSMRRATLPVRLIVAPIVFQSTLSMRRATTSGGSIHSRINFNPRSP